MSGVGSDEYHRWLGTLRSACVPYLARPNQPHLHQRWNEGCHDVAVLHAEITALGYRGSLRTVYRYLQPLRTGTASPPAAVPPKIGEVTSLLLGRPDDPSPRQQQLLAEPRGHCAQLERLAGHVTSWGQLGLADSTPTGQ